GHEPARVLYCVFDLLYLDGKDLRGKTLLERKAALKRTLPKSPLLLYSEHVVGEGIKAFNRAKRANEEGVIAKLASGQYHTGVRTREWLKVKATQEQEVVIVGFTAPRRSRKYFGSLVLAVREGNGWKYAGRAGRGFTPETRGSVYETLAPFITNVTPAPEKAPDEANPTGVGPKLGAEVKFTEWTSGGQMRPPVSLSLRTEKPATEVIREKAKPL